MKPSNTYQIATAADLIGVSPGTLRRWEKEGRLPFRVRRSPVGHRIYSAAEVDQLRALRAELHPKGEEPGGAHTG